MAADPTESVPTRNVTCPRCKGNGRIDMLEHCPACKGSGRVTVCPDCGVEGCTTEHDLSLSLPLPVASEAEARPSESETRIAVNEPTEAERRAAKAGLRLGKLGVPVTDSPFAPSDRSAEAVAWRRGWTLGNQAHQEATDGS